MNADTIFILHGGVKSGPYAVEDVRAMVVKGDLKRQDWAWREGMEEWRPLDQVIGFDGLPPLPAPKAEKSSKGKTEGAPASRSPALANSTSFATISGAIGLLFLLVSVFAIGSCTKAANELQTYERTLNSPEGATEIFLRSFDRGMKGDPFGQYFDVIDAKRTLEAQAGEARMWAILCVTATGVCGIAFLMSVGGKRSMSANCQAEAP